MEDLKVLEQQINNAPEQIKKFLTEEKWVSVVGDIVKKDSLSAEQKTSLENEVLFVLIGLDLFSNLEKNIAESLSLEPILAKAIVVELEERIFKDIKSFLPTEAETSTQTEKVIKTPDLGSLPPVKSTVLEIPPQLSIVPEGKVMDHLPPISPTQPKMQVDSRQETVDSQKIEIPKPIAPIIQPSKPPVFVPPPVGYSGKDPYREPLE